MAVAGHKEIREPVHRELSDSNLFGTMLYQSTEKAASLYLGVYSVYKFLLRVAHRPMHTLSQRS